MEFAVIGIEITGTDAVIRRLGDMPGKITTAAKSSLDAWATQLAGYIKSDKLSGDPLNRRRDRLSSSVHPMSNQSADSVSAGAGGGAGVPYAHIHEYGGVINHPGGTAFFMSALLGRAFFVSNASYIANARALPRTQPHTINMPERSYMRSAFREQAPDGIAQLRAAVREAIA